MNPQTLRQYLGDDIARYLVVGEKLKEFWDNTPIDPKEDWDLNPHLYIAQIAKDIADKVSADGFPTTKEDVLLYWLTMAIHNGMFLPTNCSSCGSVTIVKNGFVYGPHDIHDWHYQSWNKSERTQ